MRIKDNLFIILCSLSIGLSITTVINSLEERNIKKKQEQKTELINNILSCTYSTESDRLKLCLEKNL